VNPFPTGHCFLMRVAHRSSVVATIIPSAYRSAASIAEERTR
jgi:hypothetical protein